MEERNEPLSGRAAGFDAVRFAALCLYSAAALALFPHFRHHVFTDGISYISIAKKYLAAGFPGAVSGHWSPMVSWLLAPFLKFGFHAGDAFNIINVMAGFFIVVEFRSLLADLEADGDVADAFCLASVPVFLWMAYAVMSPDALVVLLMLRYFRMASKGSCFTGDYGGAAAGALAGAGYLVKTYFLPFFLLHFTLAGIYNYFRSEDPRVRRKVAANFFLGVAVASLIASFWVVKLYERYGRVTIGTSGNYNYALMFSEKRGEQVLYRGFFPPSDGLAISAWEDPPANPVAGIPFLSAKGVAVLASFFSANVAETFRYYFEWSVFSIPILIVSLLMSLLSIRKRFPAGEAVPFYTFSALVFPAAYFLLLVEERYVWVNKVIFMALGAFILTFAAARARKLFARRAARIAAAAFLALTFCAEPAIRIGENFDSGRDFYELSKTLAGGLAVSGNLASDSRWADTLCLAYFMGSKYYGTPAGDWGAAKTADEISKSGIDYFLVWDSSNLALLKELDARFGKVEGAVKVPVTVYRVKK